MKHVVKKSIACVFVASGACALSDNACASGPYGLQHDVIAGGGGPSSGGAYQITSTFGQSSVAVRAGGEYVLFDGFWSPFGSVDFDLIFANGFESF